MTTTSYQAQDLISHRVLIREANEHAHLAQSPEFQTVLANLEQLVDRVKAILAEKVRYIEKTVKTNHQEIEDMIFAQDERGLIRFIRETILQTSHCEAVLAGSSGSGPLLVHPTADLDELIRDNALMRNHLHQRVCDYLYRVTQLLIGEHKTKFMTSGSRSAEENIQTRDDFITMLRFIDWLARCNSPPHDEGALKASLRQDYVQAILEITDKYEDLRVIKLSAQALGNAATPRAWPAGSKEHKRVMAKFVGLAQQGEKLIRLSSKKGFDITKQIEMKNSQLTFRLNMFPEKHKEQKRKRDSQGEFDPLSLDDEDKEDALESQEYQAVDPALALEGSGTDILVDLAQAQLVSSTTTSDQGSDLGNQIQTQDAIKKAHKSSQWQYSIVCVEFPQGIEEFLANQSQLILEARKTEKQQQEADQMQIDSGQGALGDNQSQALVLEVTLRDIAEKIFSDQYEAKCLEASTLKESKQLGSVQQPLSLKKFKADQSTYYEDSVSLIEASMILGKSMKDRNSFDLAIECSIQCYRRLVSREEHLQWTPTGSPFSRMLCETVGQMVFHQLARTCLISIEGAANAAKENQRNHVGHAVGLFQTLKQLLRKIKETSTATGQAGCETIHDLLLRERKSKGGANQTEKPYLVEILSQIAEVEFVKGDKGENDVLLKISELEQSYDSQNSSVFLLCRPLVSDLRFQSQAWLVAQQVYEILSNIVRHNHASTMTAEMHQKFTKVRKEVELLAQKTLLKNAPLIKQDSGALYFVHHLDMLRVIVHFFIRSAWVVEGLAPGGERPSQGNQNLKTLIEFTCKMIRAADQDNFYLVLAGSSGQQSLMRHNIVRGDLITFIYFLIRRLTLDNNRPTHPPQYDSTIIESELFSDAVFGKIMDASLVASQDDQAASPDQTSISRLKNSFIGFLGTICYNDPTQIPKIIENGTLTRVAKSLNECLPVHTLTVYTLYEFLRMIVVHEQGREFVKQHQLFNKLIEPTTLPKTSAERTGSESDRCQLALVMQTANLLEKYKKHSNLAMSELIRNADPHFQETTHQAVDQIIKFLKPKAEFLQKEYYKKLAEYSLDPSLSKRRFQLDVTEELMGHYDYHILKYEIDKLHTLCYSTHYDAASLMPYLLRVFTPEVLDQLLELYEILSTIKPVFDPMARVSGPERQSSIFSQFAQMFTILISHSRNGQASGGVQAFEKRLRAACKNLAEVFSAAVDGSGPQKDGQHSQIKHIDLVEFLRVDGDPRYSRKVPEICLGNKVLGQIESTNLRGYLIASVLIVGQYISIFEGTRKPTQEQLCIAREWSSELRTLSGFTSTFNECNHTITDEFFQDQAKFVEKGVVTKEQIEQISIPYSKNLKSEEKAKFAENRKQIEENIDMYRENLTYLDPDYIRVDKLLQIVWDYWRGPSQRHGHSVDEQILGSKTSYTKLTIDNIKDMNRIIDDFERLRGEFDSTEFLTTISRLYTYISELGQLIASEKLNGLTFYQFVEQGCLTQLVKIFNIIKSFKIKQLEQEEGNLKKVKFIAVDCVQSINKQLKGVLTHFINCSASLVNATLPSMPALIEQDSVYDSTQHFFANYFRNLVEQLASPEDADPSNPSSHSGQLSIPLCENKDLRSVQILLLQNISSGFEKCKYLRDEHGKAFSSQDKGRANAGGPEAAKRKKLYHDESLIMQITSMGFDRTLAKKALKLTGDVNNAVTFLLESGEAALAAVSDSEDEEKKREEEAKKAEVEKKAKQEEEKKKAEVEKNERKAKLITVADFEIFLKRARERGLEVVTEWSTLTAEQARCVPYKTQKKYAKLFDQYIQNLAKSPTTSQDDLTKIFDRIFDGYVKDIQKITEITAPGAEKLQVENLIALFAGSKNFLTLLHRLTRLEAYAPLLRLHRHDRAAKLMENVIKTLATLTRSKSAVFDIVQVDSSGKVGKKASQLHFIYLSNVLELLYRSLQLFLVYQQTLASKKAKGEHKMQELEKREKASKESGDSTLRLSGEKPSIANLKQKQLSLQKKFDDLEQQRVAQDSFKFIKLLQQGSTKIKVPRLYSEELSILMGQIVDITRIIEIQKAGKEASSNDQIISGNEHQAQLVMCSSEHQAAESMTTGTATLNIIQIQKLAYDEERLQQQMEYLLKKMMAIKAQRVSQYKEHINKDKEDKVKDSNEPKPEFTFEDSAMDFKQFMDEFNSQVLGFGKSPANPNNQNRYGGGPPPVQQNLSQPSNELSQQLFSRVFKKAISKTCDVVIKQTKAKTDEKAEESQIQKTVKEKLNKAKNIKETLSSSKVQLKKETVEEIRKDGQQIVETSADQLVKDKKIYDCIFGAVKDSADPWLNELKEFLNLQKSDSKELIKITKKEEDSVVRTEACLEQWQELSLIELRNLSSLARVYINQKSGIIQEFIDSKEQNLLTWFKDAYLPLRLLKRNLHKNTDENDKPLDSVDIWYELASSAQVEKLDKHLCLFLNELTGYGHLYCDEAKNQRQIIRRQIIVSCLETLQSQAQNPQGVKGLNVLQQAQLLSSLLIVQHLINQYNQHEYNRVILSRDCYYNSIREIFEFGNDKQVKDDNAGPKMRFIRIINDILGQVVKMPALSQDSDELESNSKRPATHFKSLQSLSTIIIERSFKICTTVALFLEGEKKRAKQLKLEQKRKKELQAAKAIKDGAAEEEKKQNKGKRPATGSGQPNNISGQGANPRSSLMDDEGMGGPQNQNAQPADDALMNADSDDDDDDIHGEGSFSQQQDLQMHEVQPLVAHEEPGEGQQNVVGGPHPHDDDYGEEQEQNEVNDEDEDQDDMDEDEDNLDEEDQIIIQQQVDLHGGHHEVIDPNVLMVDEEDEEELIEGDVDDQDDGDEMDGDDHDEDDDLDDDFDDLPSDEDDGGLFLPMGMGGHLARHRAGGRNNQAHARDILFNVPEGGAGLGLMGPPGDRMRVGGLERGYVRLGGWPERYPGGQPGGANYGPNWSREEEEVSQTLRNLRGMSGNNGGQGPHAPQPHGLGPPRPGQPQLQNCRYRIELDIARQFNDASNQALLSQAKKSIEQIKQEQSKPANNQISSIFQILKPIDLQGLCTIAQAIEAEFIKGSINRDNRRIEEERAERQERLAKKKKGEDLSPEEIASELVLEQSIFADESDEDDGPLRNIAPINPYRDEPPGPGRLGDPHGLIQGRLMDIRMDIERLLHEGVAAGIRDPILEMDDPLGFGGIFGGGGPGYPPRQFHPLPQRERDRVNQANAQRDVREQAVNWDTQLFRAPETSAQENAQNLILGLIEDEAVVIEEVEEAPQPLVENREARARSGLMRRPDDSHGSGSSGSQSPRPQANLNPADQPNALPGSANRPQNSGDQSLPAHLQDINEVMASLGVGQDNNNNVAVPNRPPRQQAQLPPDEQQALDSFFSSLNQPAGGQPVQPPAQQNQNQPQPAQGDALLGGMSGINQAIDQIRDEMQNNAQQLDQAVERINAGHQNSNELQEAEEVPEQQQPVMGSSLVDDEVQMVNQQQQPAAQIEEVKEPVGEQQQEPQPAQQQPAQPEELTFGAPNSILIANGIEPAMLYDLPEDVRVEILSSLQDQLDDWARRQQQQQQQQPEQPGQQQQDNAMSGQQPDAANNNNQNLEGAGGDPVQAQPPNANGEAQQQQPQPDGAQQQPGAQNPPNAQPAEEEMDPEVMEAIRMGLDPDFIANIPAEMRRELMRDASFRAANTGRPQPSVPMREPEAMDIASIVATVEDPALRREMLQGLQQEQIDQLPPALRAEAMNIRRGHGPGGLLGGPPGIHYARPPRGLEPMMGGVLGHPGGERDALGIQMDLFMERMRRDAGHPGYVNMHDAKEVIPDPKDIALDQLLIEFTSKVDLEAQEDHLLNDKSEQSLPRRIQEQLEEDQGSVDSCNDKLLKNILATICLNSNVKTDIVQLLRLILKQKSSMPNANQPNDQQQGYQYRNKVINTLTFVLKIAAQRDTDKLLALFEIELPKNNISQVKVSDFQWNKIFLTVTGILRVLIDNNKKLILHMLKCLIQKDECFVNKGDHVVSSHAAILKKDQSGELRPPLAEIIQITRVESEDQHKASKKSNMTEDEKRLCQEQLVRVRNIKLLIHDVFKQFDLLFAEIAQQQAADGQGARKNSLNNGMVPQGFQLGQLSPDSVKSLTDLLYLPQIDKKLLTALGDCMFRLSNLKDQSLGKMSEDKNLKNWTMISERCQEIASDNLSELQDLLLNTLMTFSGYNIPFQAPSLNRSLSQVERSSSQISSGAKQGAMVDQRMQDEDGGAGGPAGANSTSKMSKDQEEEFKELLTQFKTASSPLMHILSLYSYFFTKFQEEKERARRQIQQLETQIASYTVVTKKDEPKDAKKPEVEKQASGAAQIDGVVSNQAVLKEGDQKSKESTEESKEQEKLKQRLEKAKASLDQKNQFLDEIKRFFKLAPLQLLIHQISEVLAIVQQTCMDLADSAKVLVNSVFDCFLPELHEEVVQVAKQRERKLAEAKEKANDGAGQGGSCYVEMEPIKRILPESEELNPSDLKIQGELSSSRPGEPQGSSLVAAQGSAIGDNVPVKKPRAARKTTIFRDVEDPSEGLYTLNRFCLQNKALLNKLVKAVYVASAKDKEAASKDITTITEFIRFMPNLLDFENKRMYFKKEIKKLRRGGFARNLTLYVRRDRAHIMDDAFSQLSHLSANELRGKMTIEYTGERGQDVGGLTRDFFCELSKEMFKSGTALFQISDQGSTYMPNPKSRVQPDHLRYFKFVGRVVGKALFEGCSVECYFVRSMYKMMIGQRLSFTDLEDLDHHLYDGLKWCLEAERTAEEVESLYESFSVDVEHFGRKEVVDLIPGGRDTSLTSDNKEYYVERKAYFQLYTSVQQQVDAFLDGFHEIIPRELVSIFTYKELELLISGLPDFKVADLKATTNYNGYSPQSPQIQWFWEVLDAFDSTQRAKFLQFATGSSKVPVEGFAALRGMNGPEPFQITRVLGDTMRLPAGHTCFNQLDLPEYPSKEILRDRLLWAFEESAGFGFA